MQRKIAQDTQWTTKTEVVTASESDTDEEIRHQAGHVRRSQKEIVEGGHTVTKVVGTELIEQEPIVEEYMSEEIEQQVRRKPKRTAKKQVVHEVEESSEEEVIVRKKPKRTRQVVQHVRKSPRRRVEYVEESSSEEEVVQTRRPVVKQRIIQQAAKVQKVVVEEPQQKVTKAKKETIKVPINVKKTETYQEEVQLETEADRALMTQIETKLRVRTADLMKKELEIQQLAAMLEAKKKEYEECQHEIGECSHTLEVQMAKPKSKMVTKTREVDHVEYQEKKVRKVTTETPVAVDNWQEIARSQVPVQQVSSPTRASVVKRASQVVYDEPVVETRVIKKSLSPSSRKSRVVDKLYGSSMTIADGSMRSSTTVLPAENYTTTTVRKSNVFGSPVRSSVVSKKSTSGWNKY